MTIKPIQECIGWHEDWPDGSSTYKVWFDWNDRRMPVEPTIDYLVEMFNHTIISLTYRPDDHRGPVWVIDFRDRKGLACRVFDHTLRPALYQMIRIYTECE